MVNRHSGFNTKSCFIFVLLIHYSIEVLIGLFCFSINNSWKTVWTISCVGELKVSSFYFTRLVKKFSVEIDTLTVVFALCDVPTIVPSTCFVFDGLHFISVTFNSRP